MRWFVLLFLSLLTGFALGQFTAAERQGLRDALFLKNLTQEDLNFQRSGPPRLPLVNQILNNPSDGLDSALKLLESRKPDLRTALNLVGVKPATATPRETDLPESVPEPLRAPLKRLVGAMLRANEQVRNALSDLTPDEKRDLIELLPQWAASGYRVSFDFADPQKATYENVLALLQKVKLPTLQAAAEPLLAETEKARQALQGLAKGLILTEPLKFWVERMPVLISGDGPDTHDEREPMLTIDLGGNDRYTGRHGAGIGYASVLIDLGGDDAYDTPDANLGAGILGIGIALDGGGSDVFRCGSVSLGCGIGGVGYYEKTGGDDSYRSKSLTQGFGLYGVGVFFDSTGEDDYRADCFAQGSARTDGVGWHIDVSGNDRYRADSVSQGASQGYEGKAAGGIGLLSDQKGDDDFRATSRSQGFGSSGGLGGLFDGGGNDKFQLSKEGQACGLLAGIGVILDSKGDEDYHANASAHGYASGSGIACLLDREGDDTYTGKDSQPGFGMNGGLGIFLESAGEDTYSGRTGLGQLSVFADLNGTDSYAKDPALLAFDVPTTASELTQNTDPKPGSLPKPGEADLERLYSDKAIVRLIGIGMPALDWMIAKHLASATDLVLFEAMISALGKEAEGRVALKVKDETPNAFALGIEFRMPQARDFVKSFLTKPPLKRLAAKAAGVFKMAELVQDLLPLTLDQDSETALNAAWSLGEIADVSTLSTAEALLKSKDPRMRSVALAWAAKFPTEALSTGKRLADDPNETWVRTGVSLLGRVGTAAALEAISAKLQDPRPGIRIEAMTALNNRVPEAARPTIVKLRRDAHPLVRAVAEKVEFGR